jgi:tetratricopeptide (TPR) repeat protein
VAATKPSATVGVPKAYENGPIDMTAAEYFEIGLKSLFAGDYEIALDALSQAIRLDPDFGEAYAYHEVPQYSASLTNS